MIFIKEKHKIVNYPSKNIQTESFKEGDALITKHYYDAIDAYVRELITVENGVKEIKHFNINGVASKVEYFVDDKRDGIETRYLIPKNNKSVKSTKTYDNGKLHGECITYNSNTEIIKQEVYANGTLVLKYLRENSDNRDITSVQIVNEENVKNLPKAEYEKLQEHI